MDKEKKRKEKHLNFCTQSLDSFDEMPHVTQVSRDSILNKEHAQLDPKLVVT